MAKNITVKYRAGTAYARGTTIDPYLTDEDREVLYEKWDNAWGYPQEFHGGDTAITCEMVIEVSEGNLAKVFGKSRAGRILTAARSNAG